MGLLLGDGVPDFKQNSAEGPNLRTTPQPDN